MRTRALRVPSRGGGHGARVRRDAARKTCLLPNWCGRPGPASASAPGPASESEAGSASTFVYLSLPKLIGFAADALQDSRFRAARICFERGAGLSPCARNTMREEIGRDTSSSQHAGHAVRRNRTRSAAGTFSGHRQRSRRICHQRCGWPSLSDDERLVEEHARSRGVEEPYSNINSIGACFLCCLYCCSFDHVFLRGYVPENRQSQSTVSQ